MLTANDRARLVKLVKEDGGGFENGHLDENSTYALLIDYFAITNSDYVYSELDEESIFYQRWRTSIKDDIENILSEKWQAYFDPGTSAPVLDEVGMNDLINERWDRLRRPEDEIFDTEKFKRYLIQDSIRSKLTRLQKLGFDIETALDRYGVTH